MIKIVGVQFQTDERIIIYKECKNVSHIYFQNVVNFWNVLPQEVLKADSKTKFGKGLKKFMGSKSINVYRQGIRGCILFHL